MIFEQTHDILPYVKTMLGITGNEYDMILEMYIDDTIATVIAFCRIDVLPYQLHGIIAQMTVWQYRMDGYGSKDMPYDVTSISEGSRSISFETRTRASIFEVMEEYRTRLEPWINRKGRVPSDIG